MATLMPMWITTGILTSFILAGIYTVFRGALSGPAWQRGLKFGVAMGRKPDGCLVGRIQPAEQDLDMVGHRCGDLYDHRVDHPWHRGAEASPG